MNQQLTLFETPEPPSAKYGVFLALFPSPIVAQHISKLATGIRERHKLRGRVRPLTHLHISLYRLGGCSDVSEKVVRFVGRICEAVVASIPAFEVRFDKVTGFGGGSLVLVNRKDGNVKLMRLRQALHTEFSRCWRGGGNNSRFDPHITLLYDQQSIPEESVEPVNWIVDEIVLVFSEVGATKYERLGNWKLGG